MATTVTLVSVVKEPAPSTRVLVTFDDGTGFEFASLADLTDWARSADVDVRLTKQLCLAYALARSSDLATVASVANKNFTFDLANNQPIRVQ